MGIYETKLARCEEIAEGTMAFHFDKPAGFSFLPGQAIDVSIAVSSGTDLHTFSIVSAPFESELVIATRMREGSAYKRALKAMPIGTTITIEGPSGSMTLHDQRERPAVFIAGGIGITPFISMLRQATRAQLSQQIILLYSNRRPEDAAFLAELQQLEQQNADFRLVATMTQMGLSTQSWAGETGLVDAKLLRQVTGALVRPIYYLAGPPMMVDSMRDTLNAIGITDDDIRSEEFYGY